MGYWRVIGLALAVAGCATAAGVDDYSGGVIWSPSVDSTPDQIALADAECPLVAEGVTAASQNPGYQSTEPYGGVGAALGVVIGNAINQANADAAARESAVLNCYQQRGFVPIQLTAQERNRWRTLQTVEARRAFSRSIIAADPSRIDEKWRDGTVQSLVSDSEAGVVRTEPPEPASPSAAVEANQE